MKDIHPSQVVPCLRPEPALEMLIYVLRQVRKYYLCCCAICFIHANVMGQLKPSVSFPVSPEVATLGKFVDMPVGTYSGVPDISVPLYTVQYKSISIPLTLNYHAGGIKVDEEASWVGLGWDLFSGGFISQSIIGDSEPHLDATIPAPPPIDNFNARFDRNLLLQGLNEFNDFVKHQCGDQIPDNYAELESYLIKAYLKRGWGQPDVYTFSFLGKSGKFVLHPVTKEVVLLQRNDVMKIERTGTQPQSGWRIRTADGMIFTFNILGAGSQEQTQNTQTWKLSSISSYDGSNITFEYVSQYTKGINVTESFKTSVFESEGTPYSTVLTYSTENSDYYLSKINTPSETVDFLLENRIDIRTLGGRVKRLKEIIISDKISKKKKRSFEFNYDYFVASETGFTYSIINSENRDPFCKRLKLKSVRMVGYDMNQAKVFNPPYSFEYDESISLPPKCSFAVDYWGFFNGQINNNTFLPNLIPLYLYRPDFHTMPKELKNCPYQANRAPDSTFMEAGVLTKLKFPTGGYQKFTYEPHKFSNFVIYDVQQVKQIKREEYVHDMNVPNDPMASKSIGAVSKATSVAFDIKVNPGPKNVPFDDIKYSTVVIRKKYANGTFSTPIKTWKLDDNNDTRTEFNKQVQAKGFFQLALEEVIIYPEANVTYWVTTDLDNRLPMQTPPQSAAVIGCRTIYQDNPPGSPMVYYGGGLRIASVELFDENDKLSYRRVYDYEKQNVPSTGKLLSPPNFVTFQKRYLTQIMTGGGVQGCSSYASTQPFPYNRWIIASGSNISLAFSAVGGRVGYGQVSVKEMAVNSNSVNSITEYEFINKENYCRPDFPEVPMLDNGLIRRIAWKTGEGITLKEESSLYQNLNPGSVFGYMVEDQSVGGGDCDLCLSPNYDIMTERFILRRYSIPTGFYKIAVKTVTDFAPDASLTTTTNYSYNAVGQLKNENSKNSSDDLVSKEYKYPGDYNPPGDPFPDSVVGNLKNKFYLPVIEEKHLFNNSLQKQILTSYTYKTPGKYVTKAISLRNASSNEIDLLKYTAHSSFTGNALEYQGKDGINTVVLWGRNGTIPIAKIEGVTLTQVNTKVNSATIETLSPSLLRAELLKLYQLANSMVHVFVYDEKGQLIEIIDPSLTSTFFEYDSFGRLSFNRDHNRNLLFNYEYHFRQDETP